MIFTYTQMLNEKEKKKSQKAGLQVHLQLCKIRRPRRKILLKYHDKAYRPKKALKYTGMLK